MRDHRMSLMGILGGLMMADTWGDVQDEIDHLHDAIGIDRPEGNRADGYTPEDLKRVGLVP